MKEIIRSTDLSNRHILDTSAVNHLYEDPDAADLTDRLQAVNVLPTTLSVVEIAATSEADDRHGLLRLLKHLGGDKRPIAMPNVLVWRACVAFSKREGMVLNDGEEEGLAWFALNKPEAVNEEVRAEAIQKTEEMKGKFRIGHEKARAQFQRIFEAGTTRPRSVRKLLAHYNSNEDFLYDVVNPIFEKSVGVALDRREVRYFLERLPHVRLFLMAEAVGVFQRAIRQNHWGHKRNPGQLDLWSAAYLPSTDVFVTDDKRQRRALRILTVNAGLKTEVISYETLRCRLMIV